MAADIVVAGHAMIEQIGTGVQGCFPFFIDYVRIIILVEIRYMHGLKCLDCRIQIITAVWRDYFPAIWDILAQLVLEGQLIRARPGFGII